MADLPNSDAYSPDARPSGGSVGVGGGGGRGPGAPDPAGDGEEGENGRELPTEFERPGGLLSRVDQNLIMYHDARSLHAEQYRACRTNLTAMNREGGPWALVVTSSVKGEGKSVTTANLAACMAELPGTRVCLLDTDFRAPSQSGIFGIPEEPGISELILDEASFKDVLYPTVVKNLDLVPAGREPASPAELLSSERFINLLQELKRRYSWVIIDTPPVNPYTDGCVLAAITNGALVVLRMEETNRELVQRTMQNIRTAGGRVLGTFLTGLAPDRDDSDRAGYYRVDASDREMTRKGSARLKARKKAEARLRQQEKAYLRKVNKQQRKEEEEDEPQV